MSSTSATWNGSLANLFLLIIYAKVVRYEDIFSSFKVWYHEMASVSVRQHNLLVFGTYN